MTFLSKALKARPAQNNTHMILGRSVDDHFVSDVGNLVQAGDVVVTESHAAVGYRLSQLPYLLGAVDCVAVADVETVVAEDLVEVALLRFDGRNHERVARDD